ncbi:MAG: zinc ribbon domain-containing protein, partial [Planctomycetota bacterium]
RILTPKDIKLIRFTNYVCEDGHYTGQYEGGGVCLQLVDSPDGTRHICGKKLRLVHKNSLRTYWRQNSLVVHGQVSAKLPEGLLVEITLRYFRPGADVIAWKHARVTGKVIKGWRTFEVIMKFPRRKRVEIINERGKIRNISLPVEVLDGEYWVEAKYLKSKQPRFIRQKLTELEYEIPDYKCMDCGKGFGSPRTVRCPTCNRKLTKIVKLPPQFKYKDGRRIMVKKIREAFVCPRDHTEVSRPEYKECPYCQSKKIVPAKKDRQVYLEGVTTAYVPKPFYDPTSESEARSFERRKEEVMDRIQAHFYKIIKKALQLNRKLDKYFASAYRPHFVENGKLDKKQYKKWLFSSVYTRIKPDESKGRTLLRECLNNNKFGRDSFDKEAWRSFIMDDFSIEMQALLLENYKFQNSFIALPYPSAQVHLNRLLIAILKKARVVYTSQLYNLYKIEPEAGDLDLGYVPGGVMDVPGTSSAFLNSLFKRIDGQIHILDYCKKHNKSL